MGTNGCPPKWRGFYPRPRVRGDQEGKWDQTMGEVSIHAPA